MAHRFIIDDQTGQLYRDFTGRRLTSAAELLKTERGLAPTIEIYLINVASDTGAVTGQTLTNNKLRVSIGNTSKPPEKGFLKAAFNVTGTLYESPDINIEGLTPSALESAFNTAVYPVYIAGGLNVEQIGEGKYLLTMKKVGNVDGVPTLDLDNAEPPSAVEVTQLKAASPSTKGQWVLSIAQQPVATITPGTFDVVDQGSSFNGFSKEISLNTTGMIAAIARGVRDFELSITHNNHQIHRSDISIHESLDPTSAGSLVITSPTLFTLGSHAVNQTETIALSGGLTYDGATLTAPFLPLAGGTMSGAVAMGSQKITGLADGTASGDAVNKGQLDALVDSAPGALNTLNELAAALGDDANFSTTITNSIATKLPLAGGTMTGNILFGDNVKSIYGTGSDLEIYHDGSNSRIVDTGDGELRLQGTNLRLWSASGENYLTATENGAVSLYYDNNKKFETSSTGATISGNLVMGGGQVKFADGGRARFGDSNDLEIYHNGTDSIIENSIGNIRITNKDDDKDIIFQSDDGSGGTTTYFRLDGSFGGPGYPTTLFPNDSSLRFGNSGNLQIINNGTDSFIQENTGDLYIRQSADDKDIIFQSDDGSGGTTQYLRLDGNLGYTVASKQIRFNDSISAAFGTDNDFGIDHNGVDARIINYTGNIIIANNANDKDIEFQCDDGSGGVETYFLCDGSASSGFPIIRFPDNSMITLGTDNDLYFRHDGTNTYLENNTGDFYIRTNANDKDIIFQSDNGSGGVETYFYLDGSASSGNPITVFPDNSYLQFGSSLDLAIVHNGTNALISNTTGNIKFTNYADDSDIKFECDDGSGGVTEYFRLDGDWGGTQFSQATRHFDGVNAYFGSGGDLQILHDGTNTSIKNHSGNLTFEQNADDKDIVFKCDNGSGGTETYFFLDGSASSGNPITVFPDSSHLTLGTGNDLDLYHDGTDSYIKNEAGTLIISNNVDNADIRLQTSSGSGSAVDYLILDSSQTSIRMKRKTKWDDNIKATFGDGEDLSLWHSGSHSYINNNVGDLLIYNNTDDGDIKFYSDDGSGGVTEYFRLDGGDTYVVFSRHTRNLDTMISSYGDADDLRISHNGTSSEINNYTGNLFIRNYANDSDIIFDCDNGSGGTTTYFLLDGSASSGDPITVFPDNSKLTFGNDYDLRIQHSSGNSSGYIQNYTGDLHIENKADDKDIIFQCDDGAGGTTDYLRLDGSDSIMKAHKKLRFLDSVKATFGNADDLQIYHDGSNSYIDVEAGTGEFYIRSNNLRLANEDGSGQFINANNGGNVELFYNNSKKLETTSAGATVSGDLTVTGNMLLSGDTFTVDVGTLNVEDKNIILGNVSSPSDTTADGGGITLKGASDYTIAWNNSTDRWHFNQGVNFLDDNEITLGTNVDLKLYHTSGNSYVDNYTGDLLIRNQTNDGNVSFICDNGSGGMAEYFRLDGGDVRTVFSKDVRLLDSVELGIGTNKSLGLSYNGANSYISNLYGDLYIDQHNDNGDIRFNCDDGSGGLAEYFRLDGGRTDLTVSKSLRLLDGVQIQFGDGVDMNIMHNGANGFITNAKGDLTIKSSEADKDIIFQSDDGSGGSTQYIRIDGSAELTQFDKNTKYVDGVKVLFGDGGDLKIFHDASNSYIQDNGTGDLIVNTNAFRLKSANNAESMITAFEDGAVNLYHNDSSRLSTTVDGISISGNGYIDLPDNGRARFGDSYDLAIYHDGSSSVIENSTGHLDIKNNANDADIRFRCDDGSGATATYFYLDGSLAGTYLNTRFPDNSRILFGTGGDLEIVHESNNSYINNKTGDFYISNKADDNDIIFQCDDGSGGTETYFFLDGSASAGNPFTVFPDLSELAFGDSKDFRIKHTGDTYLTNYSGDFYIRQTVADKDIIFKADDGSGGTETYFFLDGSFSSGNPFTVFPDLAELAFGDSKDLRIKHDGTDSYITELNNDLYIINRGDDKDIIFQCDDGSGGTETYFYLDGSISSGNPFTVFPDNSILQFGTDTDLYLYSDGGSNSYIKNSNGHLQLIQYANDKDIIFKCDDGSGGEETYFFLDGSYGSGTYNWTCFPDNSIAAFGDGKDLRLYHNGTDSFINNNTGDLNIVNLAADKDILFKADDGSGGTETYFFLDGSKSTGNPYTIFPNSSFLGFGNDGNLLINHGGSGGSATIQNNGGDINITQNTNNGDVTFFNDDGSGSTAIYLSLDGGREIVKHHRGVEYSLTSVSNSDYTVTSEDYCIIMHSLTAQRTITIPTAQRNAGRVLIIKEKDGYASSYNIVIDPQSSVTIDGNATYTISTNKGSVTLISDGSNWFVI